MKVDIIPSLLTSSRSAFKRRLKIVSRHCLVAQLDVLNNTLVPFKDFCDPKIINRLRPAIALEIHLMVSDPLAHIPEWNYLWVSKIIFHFEATADPRREIMLIKSLGKKAGLAVNPATPVAVLSPYRAELDTCLIMTVNPGQNGSPFLPPTLKKISRLRKTSNRLNIEVDGGINPLTAKKCLKVGANLLVAGSYLENERFEERLLELRKAIQ